MNTNKQPPGYLSRFAQAQLQQQILPFWSNHALQSRTGVMQAMDAKGLAIKGSPAGSVMNARALWSFALHYQVAGHADQLMTAMHLYDGFSEHFIDPDTQLVHWQLPSPNDESFHILGQTYAIYALTQFALSTHNDTALAQAKVLAIALNRHFQREDGTFVTTSDGHQDPYKAEPDTIATCNQLHVLEALTQLYRASPKPSLRKQLTLLIDLFLIQVFPAADNMPLAFSRSWVPKTGETSIGHNFEAPWLVALACRIIDDPLRLKLANKALLKLLDYSLEHARHPSGNFYFGQTTDGQWQDELSWWTQTEASNALLWAYQTSGAERYLNELKEIWQVIQRDWVDAENGEWHTNLDSRLQPAGTTNKGDIWRSNYHTTRACVALVHGFATLEWTNNTQPSPQTERRTSPQTQFAGNPILTF